MVSKRNKVVLLLLIAILVLMSIGYAAFSSNLNIKGTSNITSNFLVRITNIETKDIIGGASNNIEPTYTDTSATFNSNFQAPGDSISYDITVSNEGTLDAVIDSIKINAEEQDVFEFEISGINSREDLLKNSSKTFTLTVKYSDNITSMPDKLSASFTVNLEYLQKGNSTNFSTATEDTTESGFGITSLVLTSLETSITMNISATGAVKYYYSLDNDKWYESTESRYTINNLKPYTNYTVYVKAENSDGEVAITRMITMTDDVTKPTIKLTTGDNVKGENDWYKGITIDANVTDNDKVKSTLYCITTDEECTPSKELTLTNNVGNVQLGSNAKAQTVCVKATDQKGNTNTKCTNEKYKVDSVEPAITTMTLTPDDDTMTITIEASDSHSGVSTYYYSKDGGATYIDSPNPNYTFTSLDEGDYLVTAYVVDNAGLQSESMAKSTTIKHAAFCQHNDINNLGDCIIASEEGTTDIAQAKTSIEAKGTPTFTSTSPSIVYSEKHATTTSTTSHTHYDNIGTGYTFNSATGYYALSNYSLKDPSSVDYTSGDYYTCIGTGTSCTTLYKITKVTSSTNSDTGTITYTLTYYPYTASVTSYDNSESGMYAASDDSGTSYYYRGAVSGNYVKFGGYYWRVIRVNGDGSVRLIYDGTTPHENGESSSNRQVTTKAFNSWWSDNAYVGYMYGDPSNNQITEATSAFTYTGLSASTKYYFGTNYTFDSNTNTFTLSGNLEQLTTSEYNAGHNSDYLYTCFSASSTGACQRLHHVQKYVSSTSMSVKAVEWSSQSYSAAHTNTKSSTMKTYLDGWYETNLTTLGDRISKDAVFCNNRKVSSNKSGVYQNTGYGITPTIYVGYEKFYSWSGAAKGPDLTCPQENDKFAVSRTTGNGALKNPVGLITADEVNMAGGKTGSQNPLYYLYSGTYYWTMSPSFFRIWYHAYEFNVSSSGVLDVYSVYLGNGVRPVINLTSNDLEFTGSGTMQDPYVVS